jgi:hypothetical protein
MLPESPCTKYVYYITLLMVVSQWILKCHLSQYLYQFLKFQSGSYLTPMSFLETVATETKILFPTNIFRQQTSEGSVNRYQRYNNIHTFLKQMFLPCIHYGHERRLACKSQFNHEKQERKLISKWFVSNTNEFSVFKVLKLTQWLADCPLVYCFSII